LDNIQESKSFPGLGVTAFGEAWTNLKQNRPWPFWRRLNPRRNRKGYLFVTVPFQGRKRNILVHRLILEAFKGPRPPGLECRHLDGNPANNHPDNLQWATHAENMHDTISHGTRVKAGQKNQGTQSSNAKLQEGDVIEIRRLRQRGLSLEAIARQFHIGHAAVYKILIGAAWSHVQAVQ
jgi:hypothetical protein